MGEIADQLVEWEMFGGHWREKKKKPNPTKRVRGLLKKKGIIKTIKIKKAILRFFKDCGIKSVKWATTDNDLYYFCRFVVDKWWGIFKKYVDNDFKPA